jgi:hypothetical protein
MSPRIHSVGYISLDYRKTALGRIRERFVFKVQLVDAQTGAHLWADRFDKPVADLFDMQDEIVARLANTLRTELTEAEAKRAKQSLHPSSMDLFFQGKASWNKGCPPEYMAQARSLLNERWNSTPQMENEGHRGHALEVLKAC